MGRVRRSGARFPLPFPPFALEPTLRVTILLSLIFSRHEIKDGGYNNLKIKKKFSPAQALFISRKVVTGRRVIRPDPSYLGESTFHTFPYKT